MGYCSGTIPPTTLPNFDPLVNLGGCPDEWTNKSYKEGDLIQSMGLVYRCNLWPLSRNRNQTGYKPNGDMAILGA